MSCDPTELGALCHECPLGPNGIFRPDFFQPVLPEHRDTAKTLVITNSPTMDDEREGRPLQGAAGQELTAALHRSNLRRRDVSITPVILCRLPGAAAGAWKRLKRKLDAANKKRAEMGAHAILPPTHYCRPRLLNDLAKYKQVMSRWARLLRKL
jgi:uracil-DNA glycosylase